MHKIYGANCCIIEGNSLPKQGIALTGRSTTCPPCSVGRPIPTRPVAGQPDRRQRYRQQTTTKDDSQQNNAGPLVGPVITFYRMSSFHSYRWNQFKVIRLVCTLCTKILHKFSAKSDVRYWVNQVRRCAAWLIDVEVKQAWIGNCKWVTRQITLTSLSHRHVTLDIVECWK